MPSYLSDIENLIKHSSMKAIYHSELICISELVFYAGIKMDEIGQLKVSDVIDQKGMIRNIVEKFKEKLFLTNEAKKAIEEYYNNIKRRRPTLALRRKPLFPSYQNQRTLSRHWQIFNTGYSKIRQAGIKNHFLAGQSKFQALGTLYKEGSGRFRLSARQYQAIVHDKKIRSGTDINDERCINNFLSLSEQADRIHSDNPNAKNDAENILNAAQETVTRIKTMKSASPVAKRFPV